MPNKTSKIFDRPLRNMSGNTTDEKALLAISLVKSKRPDLWERLTAYEKKNEVYGDNADELQQLLSKEMNATIMDCVDLGFEIRKQVRCEAGLPH